MEPFDQQIFAALQPNGMICEHRTLQYFVTDKQKRDIMDAVLERFEGQITNIFGVMNWESMSFKDRKQTSTANSTNEKQLRNIECCDLYLTVDAIDNEKGEVLLSSFLFERLTAENPIPGEFPNVQLMNWKKEMPFESGTTIETILESIKLSLNDLFWMEILRLCQKVMIRNKLLSIGAFF